MRFFCSFVIVLALMAFKPLFAQIVVDFEGASLKSDGTWNGSENGLITYDEPYTVLPATFDNSYSLSEYDGLVSGYWSGFSFSTLTDNTTAGYSNQYSTIAASGAQGSEVFGVVYVPSDWMTGLSIPVEISFDSPVEVNSVQLTNSTYSYLAMKNGDDGAGFVEHAFAQGDSLTLIIRGFDAQGNLTDSICFDLARNIDIVDNWTNADLSILGTVKKLSFALASSDPMIPAYFCMDNLNVTLPLLKVSSSEYVLDFEDITMPASGYLDGAEKAIGDTRSTVKAGDALLHNTFSVSNYSGSWYTSWYGFALSNHTDKTTAGFVNQYSAYPGSGSEESEKYAVGFVGTDWSNFSSIPCRIEFESPFEAGAIDLANSTYAFLAMKYGNDGAGFVEDAFKAGDYFTVTITGYDDQEQSTGAVSHDLARDANVQDEWSTVMLTDLGTVSALEFMLASSDPMMPNYFCFDNLKDLNALGTESPKFCARAYPNPFTAELHIETDVLQTVKIFDMYGRLVAEQRSDNQFITLHLAHLTPGIYFLTTQDGNPAQRIVKQ